MSNPVGQIAFSKQKEVQDQVQAIIAEDMKSDPNSKWEETQRKQREAADAQAKAQTEAQKQIDKMPTGFKSPEGFTNVVGVGANPVMEAMTAQLDEQKKTNDLLSQLVTSNTVRTSSWLDAPAGTTPTAAPSRAAMLRGK
jgi:hypothetical protein